MAMKHKIEDIGINGIYTVPVSAGRQLNVNFDNADGHTFNVVGYLYTLEEDVNRSLCIVETGLTAAYHKASIIGYEEIGVQVTTSGGTGSRLEVLECKL